MANQISVLKQTELCGQQFMVYGSVQEPMFFAQDVATMLRLTNVGLMVKCTPERGHNALFFIPLEVFIML